MIFTVDEIVKHLKDKYGENKEYLRAAFVLLKSDPWIWVDIDYKMTSKYDFPCDNDDCYTMNHWGSRGDTTGYYQCRFDCGISYCSVCWENDNDADRLLEVLSSIETKLGLGED